MQRKVFISYRAAYETYAAWIQRELANKEINAFIYQHHDDEIDSGNITIEQFVYPEIERSEAVILILAGNTLDKCVESDDWVRLEIEKAVELGKRIIPIYIPGFNYPGKYPDSLYFLSKLRAIKWNTLHPEQSIANILKLLPQRTFLEKVRNSMQKSSAAIETLRRSIGSAIARTCRFAKTRLFENPVVRNRMKCLAFRPLAILIVLFLLLFVVPVFVIGPTDWASSGLRNQLADCYEWKILVKRDRDKAYSYFLKSVEADSNAYAMAWVARYLTDCMPQYRYNDTIYYYKKDGRTIDSTQYVKNIGEFKEIRDSLYGVIRHLFLRAGEKGYAAAYINLGQFIQNNQINLGLSDSTALAEAANYFSMPNKYANYNYKGLWENVVYRIEFQLIEKRLHNEYIIFQTALLSLKEQNNPEHLWKYVDQTKFSKRTAGSLYVSYYHLASYYQDHPSKVDSTILDKLKRHAPLCKKAIIQIKKHDPTQRLEISEYPDLLFEHGAYDAADELYRAGITYDTIRISLLDNHTIEHGPYSRNLLGHARIALLRGDKDEAYGALCHLVEKSAFDDEAAYHLLKNYELNDSLRAKYRELSLDINYIATVDWAYLQKRYDVYTSELLQYYIDQKKLPLCVLSTCAEIFTPDNTYSTNSDKKWNPRDSVNLRLLRQLRKIAWQKSNKRCILEIDTLISRHIVPKWHHGLSFELDYFKGSGDTIGGLNRDLAYDREKDMIVPRFPYNYDDYFANSLYIHYILTDRIAQFVELLTEDFSGMQHSWEKDEMSFDCFAYYYNWAKEHDSEVLLRWLEEMESVNFENRAWILHNCTEAQAREFRAECERIYGL